MPVRRFKDDTRKAPPTVFRDLQKDSRFLAAPRSMKLATFSTVSLAVCVQGIPVKRVAVVADDEAAITEEVKGRMVPL